MDNIEETLNSIKDTLVFLLEQGKLQSERADTLEKKIESVSTYMMDNIVNPSIKAYDESRFNDFNEKYGERLGKFDGTLQKSLNDPEYSAVQEAWNELEALPQDERADVDEEAYISGVEEGLNEYVDNIKQSLGLPADAAVEITDDGNGNVEVAADTDGDGEVDSVVSDEQTADVEKTAEEPATEEVTADEEEEEDTVDPELQAELDEWTKNNKKEE